MKTVVDSELKLYNYWKAKRRNISIELEHEEDSSWNPST